MPIIPFKPGKNYTKEDTYMLYKGLPFMETKDLESFGYSIHLLEYIHSVYWINQVYKKLENPIQINPTIFYSAIKSVFTYQAFNTKQLETYLIETKKVERFKQNLSPFINTTECYVDYNVVSILLGIPLQPTHHITIEHLDHCAEFRFNTFYNFYTSSTNIETTLTNLNTYKTMVWNKSD